MTAATRRLGRTAAGAGGEAGVAKNGAGAERVSNRANQTTPGTANVNKR